MCYDAKNSRECASGPIMGSHTRSVRERVVPLLSASTSFSQPTPLLYNHLFMSVFPISLDVSFSRFYSYFQ